MNLEIFKVAHLVAEEFFQQGDREAKELHQTPMVSLAALAHSQNRSWLRRLVEKMSEIWIKKLQLKSCQAYAALQPYVICK